MFLWPMWCHSSFFTNRLVDVLEMTIPGVEKVEVGWWFLPVSLRLKVFIYPGAGFLIHQLSSCRKLRSVSVLHVFGGDIFFLHHQW